MSWVQEKEKSNNLLRYVFLFWFIIFLILSVIWAAFLIAKKENKQDSTENETTLMESMILSTSVSSSTSTSTTITSTTTTLDLSMCLAEKINDGICDFENLMGSCFFDSYDCCLGNDTALIGDGICQEELDNLQCNFDAGDCRTTNNATRYWSKYPACVNGEYMPIMAIGDGFCDDILNGPLCGFDEGDCCLQSQDLSLEFCTTCACLQTTSLDNCSSSSIGFIGDLYCDDENNNEECLFDAGDCCPINPLTQFCSECACLHGDGSIAYYLDEDQAQPLCIESWFQDGFCDDFNNKKFCLYDHQDCCNPESNFDFCSDCQCKDDSSPFYSGSTIATHTTTETLNSLLQNCTGNLGWIGDGICDQDLNVEQCFFDAYDCHHLEAEQVLVQDCHCGKILQSTTTKIVGGNPAQKSQIPWQVGITYSLNSPPFCGGTIIGPKTILTAAHCFTENDNPANYIVMVGVIDISNQQARAEGSFHVHLIHRHPQYDEFTQDNDYAVLTLTRSIEFSENANAACLPTDQDQLFIDKQVIVSGWGNMAATGAIDEYDFPNWLQFTRVTSVSNEDCCHEVYNKPACKADSTLITENMICAGIQGGGVDSCQGDSGGPLTYFNATTDSTNIIGVVSWGFGCALPGQYGVYARVTSALSWIAQHSDNYTISCNNL